MKYLGKLLHFKYEPYSFYLTKTPNFWYLKTEKNSIQAKLKSKSYFVSRQKMKSFLLRFNPPFVSVLFWGENVWKPSFCQPAYAAGKLFHLSS